MPRTASSRRDAERLAAERMQFLKTVLDTSLDGLVIGPGSPGKARLEVVDHGKGIEPAIQDRIFEPFLATRLVGDGRGAGLGLSISHSIGASHGGTLTVVSELGEGSTFRMELPVATPQVPADAPGDRQPGKGSTDMSPFPIPPSLSVRLRAGLLRPCCKTPLVTRSDPRNSP
jgi:hypothetical protein